MTKRTCGRVLIVLLSAYVTAAGVASSDEPLLLEDDFEQTAINPDGTLGFWDGPADPSVMYVTDRVSHSGTRALELKYIPGTYGASYMYKQFVGLEQVYFRWYQRWSPGFVWEPSATKMVILRPRGGYPQFYPEVLWANGQLAIQAQVIAEANWDSKNFYQNVGEPVVFAPERWYCIEVFVKLNRPGSADGELAAWIDGELKLSHTGREFRGAGPLDPAPSTAQIQSIGLTGYYGGISPVPQEQYSWIDDAVFSSRPIGFQMIADDFESSSTGPDGTISRWDGPSRPSLMHIGDGAARSGAHALELHYMAGSYGAGYMARSFLPQDQVYARWYQKWSPGFVFDDSAAGLLALAPSRGYPQFYPLVAGVAGRFAIQAQVLADRNWGVENFFQNVGDPVDFQPDRWYCLEVGVRLNSPGVSDGVVAAWIDGEPKLLYAGRQFRGASATDPAPSTARIQTMTISAQYGWPTTVPQDQFAWQDDFVASTQPIGCRQYPSIFP